ncbi:MAG TPA: site-2 protease family protein [Opitutaceae bacterium]|nr:site-2 protease family protein [Opitutaceae bacterium]
MEGVDLGYVRIGLFQFLLTLGSLVLHGWIRAWTAERLGDPTPRATGRVTLNPLAHLDLIGTVVMPLFCLFGLNGLVIGWAKPVLTTPVAFRRPRAYDILSLLAGPGLHFLIAAAAVVVGVQLVRPGRPDELFGPLAAINAGLGITCLLPVPPLPGGEILRRVVNMSDATFARISRWSGLILMLALNFEIVVRGMLRFVAVAYWPYLQLCRALKPAAVPLLFG